jgi:hypothetical protein
MAKEQAEWRIPAFTRATQNEVASAALQDVLLAASTDGWMRCTDD